MSPDGLPHIIEVRTLAARGVELSGAIAAEKMPRLLEAIASPQGDAVAQASFGRDEEGRYVVDISVDMPVSVLCQRCMQPMDLALSSRSQLAVVWSDDQAEHIPARFDPLVAAEEVDFWQVIEDELLLALPAFNYHEDVTCGGQFSSNAELEPSTVVPGGERDNPFQVLKALKGQSDGAE